MITRINIEFAIDTEDFDHCQTKEHVVENIENLLIKEIRYGGIRNEVETCADECIEYGNVLKEK